jgi:hypothetical protein
MTDVPIVVRRTSLSDRYLVLLSVVLAGYAFLGKGFAYVGMPPIFIGELAFIAGLVALLWSGCVVAVLTSLPSLILAVTMAWVLLRTLPFFGAYGFEALRDSVIVMYGGFAFVVAGLLLEDERRLNAIIGYYGAFLSVFVPAIPFLFALSRALESSLPTVPGSTVPVIMLGPGELPVHLAGALVFALAGFRKVTALWIVPLIAGVVMASALTRGGMLAFLVPVVVAVLVLGKLRQLLVVAAAGLTIFAAAYALETIVAPDQTTGQLTERAFSTRQIVRNAESIVGDSDPNLEGTKTWRLEWWHIIIRDTIFGANFWSGRGFGPNIADEDGFGSIRDAVPLRSPHNVHMTILARAGVPGLVLWLLTLVCWLAMIANATVTARRRGQTAWSGLFLFIGCYVSASLINATFDVAIEGPMQGIWFWCLIGLGIGSVMIHRGQPSVRSARQLVTP